jgi:hypothetical protein
MTKIPSPLLGFVCIFAGSACSRRTANIPGADLPATTRDDDVEDVNAATGPRPPDTF